jgi:hypothetical protein
VCSVPFVVVTAALVTMCIYFCHYEHTSYNLVISLVTYEWCDNDNHDLPQHMIGTVKWQDAVDGNKCR